MELFERIRYLSGIKKISLAKIAAHIGESPQNFNQWFKPKSQRRLWEHLPKILELFPDVRREWLYFGQEPAFTDGKQAEDLPTKEEVQALKEEIERLKTELLETNRQYRQLSARLLIDGVGDKNAATGIGKAAGGQG